MDFSPASSSVSLSQERSKDFRPSHSQRFPYRIGNALHDHSEFKLLVAMERNRRASALSGTRRQRGRNPSEEEDKMPELSESRFGKRLSTSGLSAPPMNKRGRWGMARDSQHFGCHAEGRELVDGSKTECNDEPAPRKHAKSRARANEDKFFMDISAVPRKPRSSISLSSRMTSANKHQDLCATQQQSPIATANGSCSPHSGSFAQKPRKRLKRSGVESRPMKISQMSVVSDREAEVAEALFVLAQSSQSCAGVLDSLLEAKLAIEGKCVPLPATQSFTIPPSNQGPDLASAGPKGRRPQRLVDEKKERNSHIVGGILLASSPSELVHSSVGETELESLPQRVHSVAAEERSFPSETEHSKILAGSSHSVPRWPCHVKKTTNRCLEEQCNDYDGAILVEQETQINGDAEEREPGVCRAKRMSSASQENTVDSLDNRNEALNNPHLSNRSGDCDGDISKSKIDLKILAISDKKEFALENVSSRALVKEHSLNCLNLKGRVGGATQTLNQESEGHKREATFETVRRLQDGDTKEEDFSSKLSPNRINNDTGTSSVSSCFSSLSSTAISRHATMGLAGWMNGFSQLGYCGSATSSLFGTSGRSLNRQSIHPALQLPHAAVSASVPKMKSCATHVYLAHYIQHEQQATRHSLWSAAFSRAATAHNLNVPPVIYVDNGRPGEAYTSFTQKAQSCQTEPSVSYNISQSNMRRTANNGSTHGSGVVESVSSSNLPSSSRASSETSTVTASEDAMAAHAQYLQMMMQQSGFASIPFPVSGSPGQVTTVFNGPYYKPHLIPHLQPLAQQAGNVLPMLKQQQAKGASSSALQQLQAQTVLQPPYKPPLQLQNLAEMAVSELSGKSKEEGTATHSSKLLHPCHQGSSKLSVLNTLFLAGGME